MPAASAGALLEALLANPVAALVAAEQASGSCIMHYARSLGAADDNLSLPGLPACRRNQRPCTGRGLVLCLLYELCEHAKHFKGLPGLSLSCHRGCHAVGSFAGCMLCEPSQASAMACCGGQASMLQLKAPHTTPYQISCPQTLSLNPKPHTPHPALLSAGRCLQGPKRQDAGSCSSAIPHKACSRKNPERP